MFCGLGNLLASSEHAPRERQDEPLQKASSLPKPSAGQLRPRVHRWLTRAHPPLAPGGCPPLPAHSTLPFPSHKGQHGHGTTWSMGSQTVWTYRGARQDQERPQLLLEVGQPQAAWPAALRGGLRVSGSGPDLLRGLHVPGALRCRSAEAAAAPRAEGSLFSVPAPARPPPARPAQPASL